MECEDCFNPRYLKCETIHFISPLGVGKVRSKVQTTSGIPTEKMKKEYMTLSLHCHTNQEFPITSRIKSQVTCKDCLESIKEVEDDNN